MKLAKPQIIILIIIILIVGGIIGWVVLQGLKPFPKEEAISEEEVISEEIFSLSGVVLKVEVENNFLMVRPTGQDDEVKVIITEDTKLFKLKYPSEKGNPTFALKRVEVTIEDVKERDNVFIKTKINIAGKKEFNDVDYIEILP